MKNDMSFVAWKTAAVIGMDRTALSDRRGLAPRGTLVGAAMAAGAWWARVCAAARGWA